MGLAPLAARLERDETTPTITAFPDGSIDTFYEVSTSEGRVSDRSEFADGIEAGNGVFTTHPTAVEPGGHAVNIAEQAVRLGNDVRLAAHLDDPAFPDFPFETASMGEPAAVSVYSFADGDVLAVENSSDLEAWTIEDLRAALGNAFEPFMTADAVCCVNWTSIEALPDALETLAATGLEGDWFVFDPGALAGRSSGDITRQFDILEGLTDTYDVVLAGNPLEAATMAEAVGLPADNIDAALPEMRERAGLASVVVHGASRAIAATAEGLVVERNFDVDASRHTGGGDRFDAGLAHALAREWGWEDALRLGNACASRYVASGESATRDDLTAFLRERQ